jgi:alanyl-tRNA synthetase
VQHSSQVGALTVTGESSVGSGVRRLEAFVGMEALRYLAKERALVAELTDLVKVQPGELKDRIAGLLARVRDAERELERMRREQVTAANARLVEYAHDVHGIRVLTHDAGQGAAADDLRTMALDLRGRLGDAVPSVVALTGVAKGRPSVVVATNAGARERGIKAGTLVRIAAQALGGGGGGKDDLAQGGGTDATKTGEALGRIDAQIAEAAG